MRNGYLGLIAAAALVVGGCGGDGSSSDSGSYTGYEGGDTTTAVATDGGNTYVEPPEDSAAQVALSLVVQRVTAGMTPSTSMECYTFYDDGSVDLRYNGVIEDSGTYYGNNDGGEIEWDSGRVSTLTSDDASYYVNSATASTIDEGCES